MTVKAVRVFPAKVTSSVLPREVLPGLVLVQGGTLRVFAGAAEWPRATQAGRGVVLLLRADDVTADRSDGVLSVSWWQDDDEFGEGARETLEAVQVSFGSCGMGCGHPLKKFRPPPV